MPELNTNPTIKETECPRKYDDWSLCYDTPITSDVLGWLSRANVNSELKKIKALPKG